MAEKITVPIEDTDNPITADYVAPDQSVFVHSDLVRVGQPWAVEAHTGPVKAEERFADVKSWASYVTIYRNAEPAATLLTWNEKGLRSVLDYHDDGSENAGRCQWVASMPFQAAPEWAAWQKITVPAGLTQRQALDALEERELDITYPATATLLTLLRELRPLSNSHATVSLKPNGESRLTFGEVGVKSGPNEVDLPGGLKINIPVLRGAVDAEGYPMLATLNVRLRATNDKELNATLRFSVVDAEAALEAAMMSLVAAAEKALGTGYSLLRTV